MKFAVTVLLAFASLGVAQSAPVDNPEMIALATHGGCLTCHSVKSGASADAAAKPVGPAWQDVAAKYKGQKNARQVLTATVMNGSNPYSSHWKGKVSGLAMPPNAVAITKVQARQLVRWILSLDN